MLYLFCGLCFYAVIVERVCVYELLCGFWWTCSKSSSFRLVSRLQRPFGASDVNGLDIAVLLEGPNTFIVSHGADDSLNYHG
jgi:hypothetical protein